MSTQSSDGKKSFKKELLILILTISILIVIASVISYSPKDYVGMKTRYSYHIHNWLGVLGVYVSFLFFQLFGKASYLVITLLALLPLFLLFAGQKYKKRWFSFAAGAGFIIWAVALFISIASQQFGPSTGGLLGGFLGQIVYRITGKVGGYLFTLIIFIIGVSKITNAFTVSGIIKKILFNIHSASKYEINDVNIKTGLIKKTKKQDAPPLLTIMKVEENEDGQSVKTIKQTHRQGEQVNENYDSVKSQSFLDKINAKISTFTYNVKKRFMPSQIVNSNDSAQNKYSVNTEIINRVIAKDENEEVLLEQAMETARAEATQAQSVSVIDETIKELEKKFIDISNRIEQKKKINADTCVQDQSQTTACDIETNKVLPEDVKIPKRKDEFGIEMFGEEDDLIEGVSSMESEIDIDIELSEGEMEFEQKTQDNPPYHEESYDGNYSDSQDSVFDKEITHEQQKPNTNDESENHDDELSESYSDDKSDSERELVVEKRKTTANLYNEDKDEKNPFESYKSPPVNILFISEEEKYEDHKKELEETAAKITETLGEFKIELTRLIRCYRGPVITRYEFEVAPGIKMGKIEGLADNIAYSLAAKKVRVIAPIPGKQAIGVEVPNKTRNNVLLGDLLSTKTFNTSKARLPLVLGKDISGKTIIADLSTMPHLLIAGTTGAGKSVCINSILCSLLYQMRPEELRLILIDPKRVEMNSYSEIPHLLAPVVTDAKKAAMALNWAVNEMERRYELLEEAGCRDIKSFNEKIEENAQNGIAEYDRLHYIVIIIDELADLMLIARKEIENVVARLAAKARAAGIHLIFATQSPRADIITGIIKANFQPRIAFTVATKMESRIVLDSSGAEKLLGKGDMLFYQPGFVEAGDAIRLQGAFVTDKEVEKVTDYLRSTCEPDYIDEIYVEEESDSVLEALSGSDEPIYHDAVRIVIDEQKASASYLQRRLQIGYNRAARMVEYMESEGIVGPAQGSKPREVLIDVYPY